MGEEYKPVAAKDVIAALPEQRRARVEARAQELIAEELALADIRKARRFTQADVAKRIGGKQVYISRLERRVDMKLSTLRDYVSALGGQLQVMVTFPEGKSVRLKEIGGKVDGRNKAKRAPQPDKCN